MLEYGLLAGISEGVTRLSTRVDVWVDEWGFSALVVGGIVVGGWVILKRLAR